MHYNPWDSPLCSDRCLWYKQELSTLKPYGALTYSPCSSHILGPTQQLFCYAYNKCCCSYIFPLFFFTKLLENNPPLNPLQYIFPATRDQAQPITIPAWSSVGFDHSLPAPNYMSLSASTTMSSALLLPYPRSLSDPAFSRKGTT